MLRLSYVCCTSPRAVWRLSLALITHGLVSCVFILQVLIGDVVAINEVFVGAHEQTHKRRKIFHALFKITICQFFALHCLNIYLRIQYYTMPS